MKRRKEFHLFSLGILLFTLTLTIVSGRIAIHAADLNTELPANDSTEISSEIPTETPGGSFHGKSQTGIAGTYP